MFDQIIAYSIKHKIIIGIFTMALIVIGLYSMQKLPIDALPDITNNQVQILTSSPNLATQEVERFITYPIELSVKSIPRIVELRSVSRFGLSIVTVVFEEGVDVYWARNQITERLKAAEDEIPEGMGIPELAPISTGLGEIYQYTVEADSGYEKQFDIMELRSVQDWIIVPQLLGVKGVAEVNTLGGILKEYEVAVNPDQLKSMGVTMSEILEALEHNNENTGGAYIDKQPYVYFIRSLGMVTSLEDISKIVIKTKNDIPILIRDVAKVQFGNTVRYGATTKDGKGEVVNGMVMMLKGENSAEIVSNVKKKMEQIRMTLPEGVSVTVYLDRSKLVNRAISTIRTNLIEGALIVIFILVLLIGNWRAGLIVATVIPLSLLFAVSMMRLFGVSGNLMSLGAIDFGLIVDGAVIIVESIVHRLQSNPLTKKLTAKEMDEQVYTAASKIRSSAAFGEIIILIVYLPILALVGIEGKMFRPMAQTVSFAILGAFILSLTYIPMMSALFLKKQTGHKPNFSDKLMGIFHRMYAPLLEVAFKIKAVVLILAVALFVWAFYVYQQLGGEFIPTLSEGDIATHVIIPPGSSLSQEIYSTTKAEQILLDNFPEIEQIVSKIGSAEVPTDPMPMEVADVMVILKDKKYWTSASSREEMFVKMEEALDDLPGVTTEFSQPIQMRFNELMTGIRSDVGIKIFGDDIERLAALGEEAEALVNGIEGVKDCRLEVVSGLPQIVVDYNRDKLALYGLHVGDLNKAVSMGFAGKAAGVVYEGERKFDLVVRLDEPFRQDISNIRNLYITLPSGSQIPLEQVADINYVHGPAQISREGGKRRVIIGFNVRDRDVESVVDEIQNILKDDLELPVGYYLEYAGHFENLKKANARLSVALPIALALILILLFLTFNSVKHSLLIFTAIPLSAIGGVFALYLRGMPFSISAGVGFIALFGVAVLNGIVLIAYFNQLKKEGMTDIMEIIREGTKVRLRPVIMTAAVASFGFLPMALSMGAGAEVQKPLATVVIGGLITATILTLFILPILYYYLEKGFFWKKPSKVVGIILLTCSFSIVAQAQNTDKITLEEAISNGLERHQMIQQAEQQTAKYQALSKAPYQLPKAEIEAEFGQMNTRLFDQGFSISQRFNPAIAKAEKQRARAYLNHATASAPLAQQEIKYKIRQTWDHLMYLNAQKELVQNQAAIWEQLVKAVDFRYRQGEGDLIEKTTADIKYNEFTRQLIGIETEMEHQKIDLAALMYETDDFELDYKAYELLDLNNQDTFDLSNHPTIQAASLQKETIQSEVDFKTALKKPEYKLGYFIQSIRGEQNVGSRVVDYNIIPQFQGISFSMGLPFSKKGYDAQIDAAKVDVAIQTSQIEQLTWDIQNDIKGAESMLNGQQETLDYYINIALPKTDLVISSAKKYYDAGEIDYLEYAQALETRFGVQSHQLEAMYEHNHWVIVLLYLTNQ